MNIDNFNGYLKSDALCQAIEQSNISIRKLGKSEKVDLVNNSIVFGTGNNIRYNQDLNRRIITCTLESKLDSPELRVFNNSPEDSLITGRGKIISLVLIALKAFIQNGSPRSGKELKSFEGWSLLIADMLVWLGYENPIDVVEKTRLEDPQLQALSLILDSFYNLILLEQFRFSATTSEIISKALRLSGSHIAEKALKDKAPDTEYGKILHEALIDAVGYKPGDLNPRNLGTWFSHNKGKRIKGLYLDNNNDPKGHKWTVRKVDDEVSK